jgi:hypothetical protein
MRLSYLFCEKNIVGRLVTAWSDARFSIEIHTLEDTMKAVERPFFKAESGGDAR